MLSGVANEDGTIQVGDKKYRVRKNNKNQYVRYKTGGLVDFTGPAWLDGTRSAPEYILNAEQTHSFFKLIDILESLRLGGTGSSQFSGDSIYDIDINVESMSSDYDVEQMAEKVKSLIVSGSRYRNNNTL
jgi:hypothetical protein